MPDGDPVEGVGLLAAEDFEEHVLHIGKVRSLGRPSRPEIRVRPTFSMINIIKMHPSLNAVQWSPLVRATNVRSKWM